VGFDGFELAVKHDFELDGITGLFGASGSGKTTMLRVLAGLQQGVSGWIRLDDQVLFDDARGVFLAPHKRGVGYVFQDGRLFPHMNVEGNLRFADARSRQIGGDISFGGVVEALELDPLLRRDISTLSGGEVQRVAIARAILSRPSLLLMDEPLSALDVRRKAGILHLIEKLPQLFDIPVIYVTHSIDEVARLANRMVVLDKGRKVAEGPVREILERLDLQSSMGRFEAGALLDLVVVRHDGDFKLTYFQCGEHEIVMPQLDLEPGRRVRVRIRARDVALATKKPSDISIRNVLPGIIAKIRQEPDTAFAETLIDIGDASLRARVTRASVAELGLTEGDAVYALIKSIAFDRRAV